MKYDVLIVGAGFAGAVCAERLAAAGKRVLIIDKRSHIGGNAFDCHDKNGVMIHPYGPHIFHTSSKRIFEYLSNFTDWRFYEHRVLACVDGTLYPIPINRTTINKLYDLDLDEQAVTAYLESVREPRDRVTTSEDVVLSSVGRDLCEKFFRGYTRKQWGLDLSELSAGVAARIPTRANDDDRYFTDAFQFMPAQGYSSMFERMLASPNIELRLSEDFHAIRSVVERQHTVYTGPIDAYFDFRFGKLPYRSLAFQHEHLSNVGRFQQTGTVNYPNDHEYTRITEFKHLTGQHHSGTSIVREYPRAEGEPYYPIPRPENEALFKRYSELAEATRDVTFVGRLAQYRYYNMDQVVGAALKAAEDLIL
ncbi:UDP-galactopyranose mutase [Trinickia sp. EG282A]|uniref:UDP-galactopyranose mutase n=1 Tax=Trinickia sp. EG282A TaxID=3237013 RepID=UPI0034D378C8